MTETPSGPPAIDPTLIAPFAQSVRCVLSRMAGIEATVEPPRPTTDGGPGYDYRGEIGFSGGLVGTVVVGFPRETAVRLVAAFAGCDVAPDTADFFDALGELANMIAGAAKTDLGIPEPPT